jgi:Rod binding domain-containing protein
MKNTNSNGTTKTATSTKSRKGTRGPRPIMTVAQLREKMLREMMVKELRKIDRKIGKLVKRAEQLHDKMYDTQTALDNLKVMRAEFIAEVGG